MPWSHGSNITNLNHYSLSFPDPKMTASLRMRFCQINTTKVLQSRSIKMGWLWTKRDFVARKTYSNFSCQNSNNLWHAQIKQWFLCTSPLDTLAENNFQLKIILKTSNFFIWKLLFRQKKSSSKVVWAHLESLGSGTGEQKPSVTDLKHRHLVKWLL